MDPRAFPGKSLLRWTLAVAVALLLGACVSKLREEPDVKSENSRRPSPDFSLKDATGATVKLSDFKGKVVLLNFWATWCGPCKIEIPWFMEFQKSYKDRDFAVLGISLDEEGWDVVKPYIESKKINYQILIGNEQVSQAFGTIDSLPTTLMIDRQGRIASMHIGLVSKKTYEQEITNLLEAPKNVSNSAAVHLPGMQFAFLRAN